MRINTSPIAPPAVTPKSPALASTAGASTSGGATGDVSALQKRRQGLNQQLQGVDAAAADPAVKAQQSEWLKDQIKDLDSQISAAQGQQQEAIAGTAADAAVASASAAAARGGSKAHGKKSGNSAGGTGGTRGGHVDTYA